MRLLSDNVGGNVHSAIAFLAKTGTEQFLHSVVPLDGGSGAIIIWKFESYQGYTYWCEKMRRAPANVEAFASGGRLL